MRLIANPYVFNFDPSTDVKYQMKGIKPVPPLFGTED